MLPLRDVLLRIQQVKLLAWFETDSFAWSDGYFGSRSWITPNPGLARPHVEDPEPAQFDAIAGGKRFFEALEHRVHCGFCFVARQAGPLDYMMNDVLFNQRSTPNDSYVTAMAGVTSRS
jgi:hypothetical protein